MNGERERAMEGGGRIIKYILRDETDSQSVPLLNYLHLSHLYLVNRRVTE